MAADNTEGSTPLTDADFRRLLSFRTQLRRFDRWSGQQAEAQGLTQPQHQLLVAIRGHDGARGPTIGDVAEYLLVRPHTAVELVDRTQELGLVRRGKDADDGRVVRLTLTAKGRSRLRALAQVHLEELARLVDVLDALVVDLPRRGPHS